MNITAKCHSKVDSQKIFSQDNDLSGQENLTSETRTWTLNNELFKETSCVALTLVATFNQVHKIV